MFPALFCANILIVYAVVLITALLVGVINIDIHNKNQYMAHRFFGTLLTSFSPNIYKHPYTCTFLVGVSLESNS